MIIFKKPKELHDFLEKRRYEQKRIGFTPTMGALHAGHLSLVNEGKKENDVVVCSIFVNPTQFNDPEDFRKYPVTIEKDILLLEGAPCDVLFLPLVQDIYPAGTNDLKHYALGFLETVLEGKFRPGHFQGVCQIMHRLLEMVLPDNLYLGRKDYQQYLVIKKLIGLIGLDDKVKVTLCPTLREKDGLAMSSRNARLLPAERIKAATIFTSLRYLKENLKPGNTTKIKDAAKEMLSQTGFRTDYLEIADASTLELVEDWSGKQKIVALAAAFINDVRLIDNLSVNT